MVYKPEKIPQKSISSLDLTSWNGGLNLLGKQEVSSNQFAKANNAMLSPSGDIIPRYGLYKWLPDTKGTIYQIKSALVNGELYHFTVDMGKVIYIKNVDANNPDGWKECAGDNNLVFPNIAKTTFTRSQNGLILTNGHDKFCYVDLTQKGFPIVKAKKVENPIAELTVDTKSGKLEGNNYKIYYGYTYSAPIDQTELSPISTVNVSKQRDSWKKDGTEFVKLKIPENHPENATGWNLWAGISSQGGAIRPEDMTVLAKGLDLKNREFIDDGSLAFDISVGAPPSENRTDGMRCKYGIETNGRPFLYGDTDNPYNIWIGGEGTKSLSFSLSDGAYRAEGQAGTDFYPTSVVGFRNNQGVPNITVLYSNTEGLSKQSTLEPKTITYGEQSFVVWSLTDQNYGAAGVSSPYGVVNYNGALTFPTTDGMMSMETKAQLQNVLSTNRIAEEMVPFFKEVKASALDEIVGTAWDNKMYYIVPSYGKDTPDKMLVRDMNNRGSWTILDIPAQWVGTVSPRETSAFVYVCQGNKIYKLVDTQTTTDYIDGKPVPFSTSVESGFIGFNGAYNTYRAIIQVVFYLLDVSGDITVGIRYKDRLTGKIRTKKKLVRGKKNRLSVAQPKGNWSDGQIVYNGAPMLAGWSKVPRLDIDTSAVAERKDVRAIIRLSKLMSEVQWFIETVGQDENGYINHASYRLSSVSFEGENIGIKADLR